MEKVIKPILFRDSFQNWKSRQIPKAQLIIADVPYNLGSNAYASNPSWYKGGDNKNGESDKAGKKFFYSENEFRPAEFMHFCSDMLVKEPKEVGKAPCMILFCAFEQLPMFIELGKKYGLKNYIPLVFRKNFSAQVLKANMKVVGNCEYGLLLYRDKLPKFNNGGRMVFNCFDWGVDNDTPKCHPCLPKGEKVYINGEWVNIEDVQVGDYSTFGRIEEVMINDAEEIIEVADEYGVTKATSNHPFLILRGNEIAWCEAGQITTDDYILWRTDVKKYISQQQKATLGSEEENLNTLLCENNTTEEKCQKTVKSTMLTETNSTITLKTCSLSLHLNTNGYTRVANVLTENGSNHVRYVGNTNQGQLDIGIIQEDISVEQYAKNATLPNHCECVNLSLKKVGSVRTIREKQKVYNLRIDGVPAFDTAIGISHNCQKPVPLLRRLIEIFTDKGDVVIDPCAGSGTTLLAAASMGRKAYGFEIDRKFYKDATEKVLSRIQMNLFMDND